jgi:hypothetical protein
VLLSANGHFAFGLSAENQQSQTPRAHSQSTVSYDAHITIIGGRGSENVGVLLLNWDVLLPDDISTKVASNGLCGTRCAWRIGLVVGIIAGGSYGGARGAYDRDRR